MSLNKSWLTITLPCVDNFFLQIFFKIFSLIVKQHAVRKPRFSRVRKRGKTLPIAFKSHKMVGVLGFEPRTSSLSGTRSNQLSYTPDSPKNPVPPVTTDRRHRASEKPAASSRLNLRFNSIFNTESIDWWSRRGSNPQHPACKAGALAN